MIKFLKEFYLLTKEKRVSTVAGAWVYFFLSSLIPLVFLIFTAFGIFGVEIATDLISRLPEGFRDAGEIILKTAKSAQEGVTILFTFTTIFSLSSLLTQMRKDGNSIYGYPQKNRRGIMIRLWALLSIAVLFALFLGIAMIVAFGEKIFASLSFVVIDKRVFTVIITFFITIIAYFVIVLLNKYISPVKLKANAIFLSSLLSLSIVFIGTLVLAIYLKVFGLNNAFYGSLATIVVFMLWAYICMTGIVMGTVFGYQLNKKVDKCM